MSFWATIASLTIVVEMVARFYSTEDNSVMGIVNYFGFFSNGFLFMGIGLMPNQVSWVFRWMFYILPQWWASQNIAYATFHWSSMDNTALCETANDSSCQYNSHDGAVKLPGWKCTDGTDSNSCWGSTGDQVLDSLHVIYQQASSEDRLTRNCVIILGFAGMFAALYMMRLLNKCRRSSSEAESTKSNESKSSHDHHDRL
eukprot:TRINITY_DN15501_c0_g2_i1.p1 TRINITY_DN15501_c0_g2~~TRINITY_DN15501_c0_g2_i1.p1  ORF type:complete len:200 (-),score=25.15 TRINITY_DN15501_c0_g2_i1:54-653(-)